MSVRERFGGTILGVNGQADRAKLCGDFGRFVFGDLFGNQNLGGLSHSSPVSHSPRAGRLVDTNGVSGVTSELNVTTTSVSY